VTLRVLPRSRLDRVVPPLVRDCALVALVPVAGDSSWAADVAWSVARASATASPGARRVVALVDLCLESPILHETKHLAATPGIAEAIAADVDLTEVAQDVEGVNFVPSGTDVTNPMVVLGSSRWGRLQAGFRNEGALLLVYLPAERLSELGASPDGVMALAPNGVDLGSPEGRALLAARDRGVELLGTVRERWSSTTPAQNGGSSVWPSRPLVVAAVAAIAIGGAAIVATAKGAFRGSPPPQTVPVARAPQLAAPVPVPEAVAVLLPILEPRDSGAWTLQLAAYGEPERALAHADRLTAAGLSAIVSALAPDASGAVWYRVQTGVYATRAAALTARASYWRKHIAKRGEGKPLKAPYSLALLRASDGARLRDLGFTGLRWGKTGPVLVGAYEHPEQAVVAQAQLDRAGIPTTVFTRTERTP
jgi:cell division septation protein DedD